MLLNGQEIIVQHCSVIFRVILTSSLQLLCSASRPKCADSNRAACHVGSTLYNVEDNTAVLMVCTW